MKLRLFAILAILILPLPALAAPRDDAVAGAARCSSYGDDHQWLECYYGAAQTVRASLGLPPAASSQVSLANAANGMGAMGGASVRDGVLAGASRCSSYGDGRQWLDCYYGAAQPMRGRLGLPPASSAQMSLALAANGAYVPPAREAQLARRKKDSGWFSGWFGGDSEPSLGSNSPQFGLHETTAAEASDYNDGLTAQMAAYSFNSYTSQFTVTLANGQVWKQVQGDTDYAHWNKPAARYTVSITPGMFGSYDLRVDGLHGSYKVDRIK